MRKRFVAMRCNKRNENHLRESVGTRGLTNGRGAAEETKRQQRECRAVSRVYFDSVLFVFPIEVRKFVKLPSRRPERVTQSLLLPSGFHNWLLGTGNWVLTLLAAHRSQASPIQLEQFIRVVFGLGG